MEAAEAAEARSREAQKPRNLQWFRTGQCASCCQLQSVQQCTDARNEPLSSVLACKCVYVNMYISEV